MRKTTEISSAELEVMQVLWRAGRPMKIQEVCDTLANNKWKYNTVGTLLLRMAEKGAVTSEKSGRTIYYTAVLDKDEYTDLQTKSLISKLYNGSVKELAVSLFKSKEMTKEDIDDIRKMFDL
ncbi:MAG: BlaI/MecI/CopY family transcriptional regulator [bacterium]|nr:BlaI/MecI/CopY family transcriptional regulator [bacterium]